MKKFILKLIPFLILGLAIGIVNYLVDPANIFTSQYESGIATHLAQGNNVTNVLNYNERKLQRQLIRQTRILPERVALGSSRIMEIHQEHFGTERFLNTGVSGATFEDILAIHYLLEEKGAPLKTVIINVDPWMLNDHHNQVRWKELKGEYEAEIDILNHQAPKPVARDLSPWYLKFSQLGSFSYFKTSIDYLRRGVNTRYLVTQTQVNDGFTRLADGSISYDKSYRNVSDAELSRRVRDLLESNPVYSMGGFDSLSQQYRMMFESYLDMLQRKNIRAELFLAPFHPTVYEFFKSHVAYRNVLEAEKYFRQVAEARGLKVYGSYDPGAFDLGASSFYDGLHCNDKAIAKILARDSTVSR